MGSSEGRVSAPSRPVHGGLRAWELRGLGLSPEEVLDFSASVNPLGPPPGLRDVLAQVDVSGYPDPEGLALREALSDLLGLGIECITLGNGSTEVVHLLARAFLTPGDAVVILSPTFGEYEVACRLAGARIIKEVATEAEAFHWDLPRIGRQIRETMPRIVFLCNPNNPTGVYLDQASVESLAQAATPGLLALDEAYLPFIEQPWDSRPLLGRGNVVLLRSMTKDYALPGLRLGYALAPAEVSASLVINQPSWSVNSLAQAAGLAALAHQGHVERGRRCVAEGKAYLQRHLGDLGLKVWPSAANFLLIEVGDGAALRARLLRQKVCVRDCTSFGLPRYIRVGIRTMPECQRLIEALTHVLRHG